jgi:UDP-glucose-4-epimerase GalE
MMILVCGGAGYIGSQMCAMLAQAGQTPVVFDNLSTGHAWAAQWGELVVGDLLDTDALAALFDAHRFDAVMHFAARSRVEESMEDPSLYFRNNVAGTLNLLDAIKRARVPRLVFSSTAAVYGTPRYTPIDEDHPCLPISPYGWSKLFAERIIAEYCRAHGLRAACLRYFNAAGADSAARTGEAHDPETHLIPNVIAAALDPQRTPIRVYGRDHPTPDGTCVRDFVHVEDLCAAHLLAMGHLEDHSGCSIFNLGSGCGQSVLEVITECVRHCEIEPRVEFAPPRDGDPPILVASNARARAALGWEASHTLQDCIESAFRWHRRSADRP